MSHQESVFWKIAGPVFAGMVIAAIIFAGTLLSKQMDDMRNDIRYLIRLHVSVEEIIHESVKTN